MCAGRAPSFLGAERDRRCQAIEFFTGCYQKDVESCAEREEGGNGFFCLHIRYFEIPAQAMQDLHSAGAREDFADSGGSSEDGNAWKMLLLEDQRPHVVFLQSWTALSGVQAADLHGFWWHWVGVL